MRRPARAPEEALERLVDAHRKELRGRLEADGTGAARLPRYFTAPEPDIDGDARADLPAQPDKYCL